MSANLNLRFGVVVPMLNEAAQIPALVAQLQDLQQQGARVIVVDGGSGDESVSKLAADGIPVMLAPRGRALQMNAGARAITADWLIFLHADTRLPPDALMQLQDAITQSPQCVWGRFDLMLDAPGVLFRLIAMLINLRSRLTGIATGDQALFVQQSVFAGVGGYAELPLMEDVALSRTLKSKSRPLCARIKVLTSARRWQQRGIVRTVLLMWRCRFDFWRGVPAAKIAERYR